LRRTPAPTRRSQRIAALVGALTTVALLALAPAASANLLTPQTGSPNANKISDLYTVTLIIAAVIFVGVEGTLIYVLIRFRARKGRVAAQIHGNTRLEIGWTLGAAVILVALAVVTFVELQSIRGAPNSPANGLNLSGDEFAVSGPGAPPDGRAVNIQVNGQQYVWRYTYLGFGKLADQLDAPYTYQHMYVPANTVVYLSVVSQDVVHSWWIPDLGGKVQAVPGYTNHTWFIAPKPGNYFGQCAFLCGLGHARMKAEVTALPPAQWTAWIGNLEQQIAAANAAQKSARAKQQNQSGAAAVEVH